MPRALKAKYGSETLRLGYDSYRSFVRDVKAEFGIVGSTQLAFYDPEGVKLAESGFATLAEEAVVVVRSANTVPVATTSRQKADLHVPIDSKGQVNYHFIFPQDQGRIFSLLYAKPFLPLREKAARVASVADPAKVKLFAGEMKITDRTTAFDLPSDVEVDDRGCVIIDVEHPKRRGPKEKDYENGIRPLPPGVGLWKSEAEEGIIAEQNQAASTEVGADEARGKDAAVDSDAGEREEGAIAIKLKFPGGLRSRIFYVLPKETFKHIFKRAGKITGVNYKYLRLTGPEGERVYPEQFCEEHGLEDGDQLEVHEEMIGGELL